MGKIRSRITSKAGALQPFMANIGGDVSAGKLSDALGEGIILFRRIQKDIVVYPGTDANLLIALAAAVAHDLILLPNLTFTVDFTVPAGVKVVSLGNTDITGRVTLSDDSIIQLLHIGVTGSSANPIVGVQGPSSGTANIKYCWIDVTNSGVGDAYGVQGGAGNLELHNCFVDGTASGSGAGYGVLAGPGDITTHQGKLSGSTAPLSEVTDTVVDTFTVDSATSGYTAGSYATAIGKSYQVKVTGNIQWSNVGTNYRLDPQYETANNWLTYFQLKSIQFSDGSRPDSLSTAYTSTHAYTYAFAGNGSAVSLRLYDGYYPDNSGTFAVEVNEIAGAGGHIYVNAVNQDPIAGTPLSNDRSAWDALNYPALHANDIDEVGGIHHKLSALDARYQTSVKYATPDVSNPPTQTQLTTALDDAAAFGTGKIAHINDGGAGGHEYLTVSDGLHYWQVPLTRAIGIDPTSASAANAASPLTTPTYDGSEQALHPSVLYFKDGWNGHKYWMALTPHPGLDPSGYETPCLYVSEDGNTWAAPAGLTNPLVAQGDDAHRNTDPEIFVTPDGVMWMFYRKYISSTVTNEIYYLSSSDGVTWSAPALLLTSTGHSDLNSPAVLWDGAQYVMWYMDPGASPRELIRRTCATPNGTWSSEQVCTVNSIPASHYLTHLSVYKRGSIYHAFIQMDVGPGSGYDICFATSADGVTWTIQSILLAHSGGSGWDSYSLYRASAVPTITGYDLWYSGMTAGWAAVHIGRTSVTLSGGSAAVTVEQLQRLVSLTDTKANIEAMTGTITEISIAWSSDTNQIGIYNGASWVWIGGAGDLNGLSDVTIATPTSGDALRYNGSQWVNTPASSGKYRQLLYTVISGNPTFLTDSDGNILTVALDME